MRLTPPACALRRNGALKSGVQAQRASPPHNLGLCQTKSWLEQPHPQYLETVSVVLCMTPTKHRRKVHPVRENHVDLISLDWRTETVELATVLLCPQLNVPN